MLHILLLITMVCSLTKNTIHTIRHQYFNQRIKTIPTGIWLINISTYKPQSSISSSNMINYIYTVCYTEKLIHYYYHHCFYPIKSTLLERRYKWFLGFDMV